MRISDWSSDVCSSDLLVFADNGEACLAVCRAQLPDLVMLDITMLGRDGWDTARAIREEHGDDPMILMVSANVHDFQRRHREDDPHDDFLTKQFEFDALLDRIPPLLGLEWVHVVSSQL